MSSQPSEVTTQSFSLQSSSPPTPSTVPPLQGIIIPPFPKRGQTKNPILRLFNSTMDEKEAESVKQHILLQLDNFDELRDIIHPLVKDLSGSTKHVCFGFFLTVHLHSQYSVYASSAYGRGNITRPLENTFEHWKELSGSLRPN